MSYEVFLSEKTGQWFADAVSGAPVSPANGAPVRHGSHGAALGTVTSGGAEIGTYLSVVGRPLEVRHYFAGASIYSGQYANTPWSGEAGVRKMLVDFELAQDGSQAADFSRLLNSCAAAGQAMDITLYHAPSTKFTAPADYFAAAETYVPIVTAAGYRHVFDMTAFQVAVKNQLGTWWPGDHVRVDAIGLEFYAQDYGPSGVRLDTAAAFADSKKLPFGLTEYGACYSGAGGCAPQISEADGISFFSYVHSFFAARYVDAAIKAHYDLISWNALQSGCGQTPGFQAENQPSSWISWYQKIYDLITGSGS